MRAIIFPIMAAALLSGCAVGPNYHRPPVDVPEAYRYEPADARNTADTAWWKQFKDPVLDGYIDEALASNWNVRIAMANVEKSAGVLMTTKAPIFPQFLYGGQFLRERGSQAVFAAIPGAHTTLGIVGSATWELDLWGKIRRQTESAEASLMASVYAKRGVILTLVSQVAGTYVQLLALDEQLEIAKQTKKAYAESVRIFEARFKQGQTSKMTLEQARSQYEEASAAVPLFENQIAITENALCVLLGRNPGPLARGLALNKLAMPEVPAGLPSELLARRPDILQAEQDLIAANALIGAAQAQYFPVVTLTGGYGFASKDLANLFSGAGQMWTFGMNIVGPIFTAGSIEGQVASAEATQKAALANYRQAIQAGFADVESSLNSREKLQEQLAAQERRVVALREYDRLAWLQFNDGYTPYLTVLYAEQQLFPAELSASQTRAASFVSVINIYKAMGGGWVTIAERGPQSATQPATTQPAAATQPATQPAIPPLAPKPAMP